MSRTFPLFVLSFAVAALASGCGRDSASTADDPITETAASTPTASAQQSDLPVLGPAPAWTLTRIDGTPLSSEELQGQVVVVDFWATWCGPCIKEVPDYVALHEKYADRGLVIVGFSMDDGPEVVQRFAEQYQLPYPLVMADQDVANAFGGIQGIPTTFVIDRQGQIRHRKVGAMVREEFEPKVASLL